MEIGQGKVYPGKEEEEGEEESSQGGRSRNGKGGRRWKGVKQNGRWERKMWRERERESDGQYGKEEEKNGFETKGRQFKLVEC